MRAKIQKNATLPRAIFAQCPCINNDCKTASMQMNYCFPYLVSKKPIVAFIIFFNAS